MPNHITHHVEIEGTEEQIKAVKDLLIVRDETRPDTDFMGKPTGTTFQFTGVDFNLLVPMPEGMDKVSKSGDLTDWMELWGIEKPQFLPKGEKGALENLKRLQDSDRLLESFANFVLALKLYKEHGFADWYEWSIARWGTKWNAYSFDESEDGVIRFDTAWSTPEPVWHVLSEKLPDGVTVKVEWSDEGGPQGAFVITRDSVIAEQREDKVWPDDEDEEGEAGDNAG